MLYMPCNSGSNALDVYPSCLIFEVAGVGDVCWKEDDATQIEGDEPDIWICQGGNALSWRRPHEFQSKIT